MLTKQNLCGIIDKHSSRGQKTKDPTDGESSGFQEPMELQTKHNIKKLSSKRPRKKIWKNLKKVLTKEKKFGIIDKHSSRGQNKTEYQTFF